MDYQVDLAIFRGPLDLLLHLVKRSEVDVLNIPIARIVEQYLQYLEVIRLIDVEGAGDFIVMASTLMEIKSRTLLPRSEEPEAEVDDPRRELVRQLLEYQKFKEAAALLEERAGMQSLRFARQPLGQEMRPDLAAQPVHAVDVWDLVSAFTRLLRETLATPHTAIAYDETPIQEYAASVLAHLAKQPRLRFVDVFEPPHVRARLVGLFLAILELIKEKHILVEQDESLGEIWLMRAVAEPLAPLNG